MARDGYADVLVVGAGPVGLVLACELARRGTSVRLVDKLAAPTDESGAIIVHARSLETETERVLTERLAALGVTVDRGFELVGFEQDEDEVRSTLRGRTASRRRSARRSSPARTAATAPLARRSAPGSRAPSRGSASCWETSRPTTTTPATPSTGCSRTTRGR